MKLELFLSGIVHAKWRTCSTLGPQCSVPGVRCHPAEVLVLQGGKLLSFIWSGQSPAITWLMLSSPKIFHFVRVDQLWISLTGLLLAYGKIRFWIHSLKANQAEGQSAGSWWMEAENIIFVSNDFEYLPSLTGTASPRLSPSLRHT